MAFFNDGEANDLFNDYFNAPLSLSPYRLISPSPSISTRLFAPFPISLSHFCKYDFISSTSNIRIA